MFNNHLLSISHSFLILCNSFAVSSKITRDNFEIIFSRWKAIYLSSQDRQFLRQNFITSDGDEILPEEILNTFPWIQLHKGQNHL